MILVIFEILFTPHIRCESKLGRVVTGSPEERFGGLPEVMARERADETLQSMGDDRKKSVLVTNIPASVFESCRKRCGHFSLKAVAAFALDSVV